MNKFFVIGVIVLISLLGMGTYFFWRGAAKGKAQATEVNSQELLERDRKVPSERVTKASSEAEKIQNDILAMITEQKEDFLLRRTDAGHLLYDIPGRRGTTRNEMSWKKGETVLQIYFQLEFNKTDALASFRNGMDAISMGEFFDAPGIGDEARLVKNVEFNKRSTNVGLHFVKGRAKVSVSVTNHKRSTVKNERELMEIVRLIEPLIIARPNFDDL